MHIPGIHKYVHKRRHACIYTNVCIHTMQKLEIIISADTIILVLLVRFAAKYSATTR